jgi:hypothetical protein
MLEEGPERGPVRRGDVSRRISSAYNRLICRRNRVANDRAPVHLGGVSELLVAKLDEKELAVLKNALPCLAKGNIGWVRLVSCGVK